MNILLAAEESAGVQTIRLLSNSNHNVKGVLTDTGSPSKGTPVATAAKKHEFSVMPAPLVKEASFAEWIRDNSIDLLLNVHSLFVICPEVIDALRVGAFNLHPGPLPEYAGLNAPSWAIYNREIQHGVTLHQISTGIDTGDIIDEKKFRISNIDTGLSVSMRCVKYGIPLIEKFLRNIENNKSITTKKQDLTKRKYYRANQVPNDGQINWTDTADQVDAFVRACNYSPFQSPWGYPFTTRNGQKISILKIGLTDHTCSAKPGSVGDPINGNTSIATADYWVTVKRCLVEDIHVDADTLLSPGDLLK